MTRKGRHRLAILALPGVVPFDLGIPCAIFGCARIGGEHAYAVTVCGPGPSIESPYFNIGLRHGLEAVDSAQTIIVPGIDDPTEPVAVEVIAALQAGARRGIRIASICSGAFVLAAAGLLDERRATTHWRMARALADSYPVVTVDPNVLFVDEGAVLTSAGLSAGIDLCLHMVRQDFGQAVAAEAARFTVAPLDRDGGQAQYIRHELSTSRESLAPVMDWIINHLSEPLDVAALAAQARMSTRTFLRRFREHTGATPMRWLIHARVRYAQELLESSARPIEEIALATGFESPVTFRARFRRQVGVTPMAYRQRFNAAGAARTGRGRS
jgi:transcriptional regulator GlxA family with amidase domain